jgi:hypothetical protein
MFGWFVSLSAGGVTAWIPEDAVVLDPSATEEARLAAADLLATAVTLSSGEQLLPVPLPPETALQRSDDGTIDVVLDPADAEARLVALDRPRTTVTLSSGEQLLPVQGPIETYAIRFGEDGTLCIDFPWGQICSPPPRTNCTSGGCGDNGTRLDGLVVPVDGRATAVTLPSGERRILR